MTEIVQQGQCLKDIAVQHCGDAMALLQLALVNGLAVTDDVVPGTDLVLPAITDQGVANYFLNNGYVPATGFITDENLEGVGFWLVEDDFEVQ